jgi:hypothetical protein
MSQIDPATYMSPMDLYDSIFWGKYRWGAPVDRVGKNINHSIEVPDPFYTGNNMNFDFTAQPPPGQPPQQQFYF